MDLRSEGLQVNGATLLMSIDLYRFSLLRIGK